MPDIVPMAVTVNVRLIERRGSSIHGAEIKVGEACLSASCDLFK